uniref:Uncharacterized protein n=1 Tax=Vespula pensylvanica TaxID=30213 RepID=A0A834UGM0_VESPE|nr:hypothetical protein H0235_000845 [Vespula pensylvanica]
MIKEVEGGGIGGGNGGGIGGGSRGGVPFGWLEVESVGKNWFIPKVHHRYTEFKGLKFILVLIVRQNLLKSFFSHFIGIPAIN